MHIHAHAIHMYVYVNACDMYMQYTCTDIKIMPVRIVTVITFAKC